MSFLLGHDDVSIVSALSLLQLTFISRFALSSFASEKEPQSFKKSPYRSSTWKG